MAMYYLHRSIRIFSPSNQNVILTLKCQKSPINTCDKPTTPEPGLFFRCGQDISEDILGMVADPCSLTHGILAL